MVTGAAVESEAAPLEKDDYEKLLTRLKAVADERARLVRQTYMACLLACVYIAIAAASVTHEDLLRETPLKLPVLDVQLPLKGFYVVAPLIILVMHLNLLLQMFLLAHAVRALCEASQRLGDGDVRYSWCEGVFPVLLVRLTAVARYSRFASWVLGVVEWFTVAVVPLLVLLLIQVSFLPYHSRLISVYHLCLLALALAVTLGFWRSPFRRPAPMTANGATAVFAIVFCFMVYAVVAGGASVSLGELSLPGRKLVREGPAAEIIAAYLARGGERDRAKEDAVNDFTKGLDLHSRNLCYADLRGADLRNADLRYARLSHSTLAFANLEGADLRHADLRYAWLAGARLKRANLRCADLSRDPRAPASRLPGLPEDRGPLKGRDEPADAMPLPGADAARHPGLDIVNLERADLQWARLVHAKLGGADLSHADLSHADLRGAYLSDTDLSCADLRGAALADADLTGAHLVYADLRGADLRGAHLDRADLWEAELKGAQVSVLQLGAARFSYARFGGAELAQRDLMHRFPSLEGPYDPGELSDPSDTAEDGTPLPVDQGGAGTSTDAASGTTEEMAASARSEEALRAARAGTGAPRLEEALRAAARGAAGHGTPRNPGTEPSQKH